MTAQLLTIDAFIADAIARRPKSDLATLGGRGAFARALQLTERCHARITFGLLRTPAYIPKLDLITVPNPVGRLLKRPSLAATEVLHELVHWAGAAHRLNRPQARRKFDPVYNREELIAELGAALLCHDLGVTSRPHLPHIRYLASYLATLDRPDVALQVALSLAQQSASYLTAVSGSAR
jgi:antirestriction protein ArdC